jgi:hypothetical protein
MLHLAPDEPTIDVAVDRLPVPFERGAVNEHQL